MKKFRKVVKITEIFHVDFEAENIEAAQAMVAEELGENDHYALCEMTRHLRPEDHESEYDLQVACPTCGEYYDLFLELCCEVEE